MKDAFKLLFLFAFSCGGEVEYVTSPPEDAGPKAGVPIPVPIWTLPPSKNSSSPNDGPKNPVSDPPANDNGLEPHPMTGEDKIIWTRPSPQPEGPDTVEN